MIVTSISTSKEDREEFQKDMASFRRELAEFGLEQNLSKLFRALIRGTIELNSDGEATVTVSLHKVE